MLDGEEITRALGAREAAKTLVDLGRVPLVHAHPDHALDTALIKLGRLGVSERPVVSRQDPRKLLGLISMCPVAAAVARAANGEDG
jgi:CBS domain-containing protein